jgi:hypothetical protein
MISDMGRGGSAATLNWKRVQQPAFAQIKFTKKSMITTFVDQDAKEVYSHTIEGIESSSSLSPTQPGHRRLSWALLGTVSCICFGLVLVGTSLIASGKSAKSAGDKVLKRKRLSRQKLGTSGAGKLSNLMEKRLLVNSVEAIGTASSFERNPRIDAITTGNCGHGRAHTAFTSLALDERKDVYMPNPNLLLNQGHYSSQMQPQRHHRSVLAKSPIENEGAGGSKPQVFTSDSMFGSPSKNIARRESVAAKSSQSRHWSMFFDFFPRGKKLKLKEFRNASSMKSRLVKPGYFQPKLDEAENNPV